MFGRDKPDQLKLARLWLSLPSGSSCTMPRHHARTRGFRIPWLRLLSNTTMLQMTDLLPKTVPPSILVETWPAQRQAGLCERRCRNRSDPSCSAVDRRDKHP